MKRKPIPFPDCPTLDRYELPDAVLAVQQGRLGIPARDGFKATHDHDETCELCRLYVMHTHGGSPVAVYPF